ncbi:MAG: GyrI-like domain-containing protein, partial [Lachnospiraceae bacterium]|nr:GyrI-like domain-containing protein [Lachnospiraceae bacterium]
NFSLPAGEYLTLSYVGSPVKTKQYMPSMYRYAKEQHLKVTGMPIEFDYIDAYETDNPDEYVIEIQLPVASSCQEEQPTG